MSFGNEAKGLGVAAIVIAIVLAVLQGFQNAGVLTGSANTTITSVITAIGTYGTWFTVLVLVGVGIYFFRKMKKF